MSTEALIHHDYYLGGSLFIAATEPDLINICRGLSYPNLRSVALDLSVQVDKQDTPYALHKLQKLLAALHHLSLEQPEQKRPCLFIQVPDPESFETINCLHHIELCHGFILPDFDEHNMQAYMNYYIPDKFYQPILNKPILDNSHLEKIVTFLKRFQKNIIAIRLGDAMLSEWHHHYHCEQSYHSIHLMRQIISQYIVSFKPLGIQFTAPAYPCIEPMQQVYFNQEVQQDLMQGLWGKTLIHPIQIEWFNQAYQIDRSEHQLAIKLLDPYSPISFISHGRLFHKQRDHQWAKRILQRGKIYGIRNKNRA